MTEKQYKYERAKGDVLEAESKVREAERTLATTRLKEIAKVEQARQEMAAECARKEEELERAKARLQSEKKWLEFCEKEAERNFEL